MRGHKRTHQYGMGTMLSRPVRVAPDQSERNEDRFVPIFDPVVPFNDQNDVLVSATFTHLTPPAQGIQVPAPVIGQPLTIPSPSQLVRQPGIGERRFEDFDTAFDYYRRLIADETQTTDINQDFVIENARNMVIENHPDLPVPSSSGTRGGVLNMIRNILN